MKCGMFFALGHSPAKCYGVRRGLKWMREGVKEKHLKSPFPHLCHPESLYCISNFTLKIWLNIFMWCNTFLLTPESSWVVIHSCMTPHSYSQDFATFLLPIFLIGLMPALGSSSVLMCKHFFLIHPYIWYFRIFTEIWQTYKKQNILVSLQNLHCSKFRGLVTAAKWGQ